MVLIESDLGLFDVDALAKLIRGYLLKQPSRESYFWKVSDAAWEALGTGFDHTRYVESDLNVALKKHLAECWADANEEKKIQLAKWIVRSWGGIKRNKEDTIRRYVSMVEAETVEAPFYGIASYSKIFSIKAPDRYAIYDARVATSLNAIQLIAGKYIFAFPIPPGRNSEIDQPTLKRGFSDLYNRKYLGVIGFAYGPLKSTYQQYLKLLKQMCHASELSVLHWEMQLFSRAVELSKAAKLAHPVD